MLARCGADSLLRVAGRPTACQSVASSSITSRSVSQTSIAVERSTLAPLGFVELNETKDGRQVAFGPEGIDDFAISLAYPVGAPIHVAFAADSPRQVDEFYAAATAAGGRDNGAPGIRPDYSPG